MAVALALGIWPVLPLGALGGMILALAVQGNFNDRGDDVAERDGHSAGGSGPAGDSTGRAIVLRTFSISRFGTIAGCRVLNGTIGRDSRVHLIRDQKVMNDYRIGSLKREKDDAKDVREGMECGIRLEGFNDIKEGDLLEAYRVDEIKRTL